MNDKNLKIETFSAFKTVLKERGYSEETIKEIYKWYDFSTKKGAANF